jgi:hypothetical protein
MDCGGGSTGFITEGGEGGTRVNMLKYNVKGESQSYGLLRVNRIAIC